MRWSCCYTDADDALVLLMYWCCWCINGGDALMVMYWCCWCTDALMLLNQDQDLLADLSIAICSSLDINIRIFVRIENLYSPHPVLDLFEFVFKTKLFIILFNRFKGQSLNQRQLNVIYSRSNADLIYPKTFWGWLNIIGCWLFNGNPMQIRFQTNTNLY